MTVSLSCARQQVEIRSDEIISLIPKCSKKQITRYFGLVCATISQTSRPIRKIENKRRKATFIVNRENAKYFYCKLMQRTKSKRKRTVFSAAALKCFRQIRLHREIIQKVNALEIRILNAKTKMLDHILRDIKLRMQS